MPAQTVDRYAVMGNPVQQSQSPFIHARFAAQTKQKICYTRVLAPLNGFTETAQDFIAHGGRGLNITVPFKLEAYVLANTLSPRAAAAGAVNTLRVDAGGLYGDNTDGVGLVRDIESNLGLALASRRVLLLGAGGAARGVILPLLQAKIAEITIVNRTAERAVELADHFAQAAADAGCRLIGGGKEAAQHIFDVVINATASSLTAELPVFNECVLSPNTLAYDMMYGPQPTVFMSYAQRYGARIADGLGMLVEQAAEAFFVWRNIRPNSAPVLAELRALLDQKRTD